jgi:hypothetical protein
MRRSRFKPPQSSGKKVSPQPRDLALFHAIYRHGPLSSSMLYEFTKDLARDRKGLCHRLEDLYHEETTPHEGPYLSRPPKQFDSFEARYQDLIHDLLPPAELALAEQGWRPEPYKVVRKNFHHHVMKSHITASIELACRAVGASYISQPEILQGRPLEFPCTTEWNGFPLDRPYMPDALFAIEHEGKRRYYFLEADRDQEPIKRAGKEPFSASSWLRKVVQLKQVIRTAKEQLGIDRPLLVLTVTTNADHMRSMLACVQEVTGGSNYQLVKTYTQFAGAFRVVPPLQDILFGWQRCAGFSAFDLVPNGTITEDVHKQQEVQVA